MEVLGTSLKCVVGEGFLERGFQVGTSQSPRLNNSTSYLDLSALQSSQIQSSFSPVMCINISNM